MIHGVKGPVAAIKAYVASGAVTAVYLLDEPYEVDRSRLWACKYYQVFTVDAATVPIHAATTSASFLPLGYDESTFGASGQRPASRE